MTEVLNLLSQEPILSISLGFALAVLLIVLFKKVIEDYLRKKYDLYSKKEIEEGLKIVEEHLDFLARSFNNPPKHSSTYERLIQVLELER